MTNCVGLGFNPRFEATTSGHTSRADGASLDAKLIYPLGKKLANVKNVRVELPKQLPSRLTTLQQACPDHVFDENPEACPAASRIGQARAEHADPAQCAGRLGVLRLPRRRGVPESGDRAAGSTRWRPGRSRRRNVHLESRNHLDDVRHRSRRADHRIRAVPARGTELRARRQRQPLRHGANAHRIPRPERRRPEAVNESRRERLLDKRRKARKARRAPRARAAAAHNHNKHAKNARTARRASRHAGNRRGK